MNTPQDLYIKGFNEGYAVASHLPEAADALSQVEGASPWAEGFRDGCEQYVYDIGPLPEMALLGTRLDTDAFLMLHGGPLEDNDEEEPDAEHDA